MFRFHFFKSCGVEQQVATIRVSSSHLEKCKLCCSRCYYRNISSSQYTVLPCQCRSLRHSRAYRNHSKYSDKRLICRLCSYLPVLRRISLSETREKTEIGRLTRQPIECWDCKETLSSTGPRWWVCTICQRECRNNIHPPWAKPAPNAKAYV